MRSNCCDCWPMALVVSAVRADTSSMVRERSVVEDFKPSSMRPKVVRATLTTCVRPWVLASRRCNIGWASAATCVEVCSKAARWVSRPLTKLRTRSSLDPKARSTAETSLWTISSSAVARCSACSTPPTSISTSWRTLWAIEVKPSVAMSCGLIRRMACCIKTSEVLRNCCERHILNAIAIIAAGGRTSHARPCM